MMRGVAPPVTARVVPAGPGPVRLSRLALWVAPLSFLAIFFFLPFIRVLAFSLAPAAFSAANLRLAADALGFTVYQAVLSTLLTLALGLPAAVLLLSGLTWTYARSYWVIISVCALVSMFLTFRLRQLQRTLFLAGRVAEEMEDNLPRSAAYLGLDVSPTMVSLARARLARHLGQVQ